MGITQWALGDKNYSTLENLEAEYAAQYPGMPTSGGVFSDARHAAATSLMSDKLGGGTIGDTLSNIGGFVREVPTFTSELLGLTPFGESWEDLKANAQAFNYPSNTSAADIYADVFSKYNANKGIPATNIGYKYGQAQAAQRFKQQQLMNRRKQDMQQRIRQAEAAEAAKQKAAADAAAAAAATKKQYSGQGAQGGGGGTNIGGGQQTSSGIAGGKISHGAAKAARGNMSGWGLADGGLIDFYRYGGFSG